MKTVSTLAPTEYLLLIRTLVSCKGNWRNIVPIPTNRTFESLATKPDDEEERELFINFISALLWWLPEERFDSFQVFSHLWINRAMQKIQQAEDEESSQGENGPPPPSSG